MGKRKKNKFIVDAEFLKVLVLVLFIFGSVVLVVSQSAFGDYENQNNEDRKDKSSEHNNKSLNQIQSEYTNQPPPAVVITVMPVVAPIVPAAQPTIYQTESPTYAPISHPTAYPTENPQDAPTYTEPVQVRNQETRSSLPVVNQPDIQTVPVSGKSIVNLQESSAPTSKPSGGSVLDTIKRGFESIGVGKISGPTPTPIPTPTIKKPEKDIEQQILPDQINLKYQIKNGLVSLTAEDKSGRTISVDDNRLRDLESSSLSKLEKKGLKLNLTPDNKLALVDNKVTAITDLPILVDINTNSFVVSTRDGIKPLSYTPDKALKNVVSLGMIADVNSKVVPKIEYYSGEVVYKFEATRIYNVLGKLPVTVPVTISVSASTGDVVSRDQPFVTRVVSLLSL